MPNAGLHTVGIFGAIAVFTLALAGPVVAAREVSTTPPARSSERSYEEAAEALGAKLWGDRFSKEQQNHVTFRLDRTRATIAITVPAGPPASEASKRLQDLADRLGWGDARLSQWVESGVQVFILRRRTAQLVHWDQGTRSQVTLNTPLITEWIRSFNTHPTVMAVRTQSRDLAATMPPPQIRGSHDGDTFLFYSALTPQTLGIQFELPPRVIAAFAVALLLWMAFPPVIARGLRRFAAERLQLDADTQSARFERWRGPLCWATVIGMYLIVGVLGRDRLDFIVPALGSNLTPLFLVPLWFWAGASANWAWSKGGSGLEPLSSGGPWSTMGAILTVVVVGPGVGLAFMYLSSGGAPAPQIVSLVGGGVLVLLGVGMIGVFAHLYLRARPFRSKLRSQPTVADDPESIRQALTAAAARASAQADEPIPTLPDNLSPSTAAAIQTFAHVARSLEPDQQAAIEVASALAVSRRHFDPAALLLSAMLPVAAIFILGGLALSAMRQANVAALITLGVVTLGLGSVSGLLGAPFQRRLERAEEQADLKVANAMDDPRRLVDALRQLEEATGGSDGPAITSSFARRRQNLERFLAD